VAGDHDGPPPEPARYKCFACDEFHQWRPPSLVSRPEDLDPNYALNQLHFSQLGHGLQPELVPESLHRVSQLCSRELRPCSRLTTTDFSTMLLTRTLSLAGRVRRAEERNSRDFQHLVGFGMCCFGRGGEEHHGASEVSSEMRSRQIAAAGRLEALLRGSNWV